jgi:hypothetical protein
LFGIVHSFSASVTGAVEAVVLIGTDVDGLLQAAIAAIPSEAVTTHVHDRLFIMGLLSVGPRLRLGMASQSVADRTLSCMQVS